MAFGRLFGSSIGAMVITAVMGGCKTTESGSDPRIVGGRSVGEPYPFFASLLRKDGLPFCGGARIRQNIVLTAAHCVEGHGAIKERLSVVFGAKSLEEINSLPKFSVEQVIRHPDYQLGPWMPHDLAILVLEDHPGLNQGVQIAKLPESAPQVGESVKVIGFGMQTSHGSLGDEDSRLLQEVALPIASSTVCSRLYQDRAKERGFREDSARFSIGAGQICAGDLEKGLIDACYGDSGGPLFRQRGPGDVELVGVVSKGMTDFCSAAKALGIYSGVHHYGSWIQKTIAEVNQPWSKTNIVQKVGSFCYESSYRLDKEGGEESNLEVEYAYNGQESRTISSKDLAKLKKSSQGTITCSAAQKQGISLTWIVNRNNMSEKYGVLIEGGQGGTIFVPYRRIGFRAQDKKMKLQGFEGAPWSLEIEDSSYMGALVQESQAREAEGSLELARGRYNALEFKIWRDSNGAPFARILWSDKRVQTVQFWSVPNTPAPQISYDAKAAKLTVTNPSRDQLVSWAISCPMAFELTGPNGENFKSRPHRSRAGSHVITFRHPNSPLGVIAGGQSLTFGMQADGSQCDLD